MAIKRIIVEFPKLQAEIRNRIPMVFQTDYNETK